MFKKISTAIMAFGLISSMTASSVSAEEYQYTITIDANKHDFLILLKRQVAVKAQMLMVIITNRVFI